MSTLARQICHNVNHLKLDPRAWMCFSRIGTQAQMTWCKRKNTHMFSSNASFYEMYNQPESTWHLQKNPYSRQTIPPFFLLVLLLLVASRELADYIDYVKLEPASDESKTPKFMVVFSVLPVQDYWFTLDLCITKGTSAGQGAQVMTARRSYDREVLLCSSSRCFLAILGGKNSIALVYCTVFFFWDVQSYKRAFSFDDYVNWKFSFFFFHSSNVARLRSLFLFTEGVHPWSKNTNGE